jgi:trans-2,3-dihydro-3-hydroxyanthranilate isomerase
MNLPLLCSCIAHSAVAGRNDEIDREKLSTEQDIELGRMVIKSTVVLFHLVDVFAVEPLTGNPLAVVHGGENLPLDLLQRTAREFNQSETTFVLPPTRSDADWRLRSFTAIGAEVFGAGHNALGAWWWLADAGKLDLSGDTTIFHKEIGDRVLPLTISQAHGRLARVVMEQEPPLFGNEYRDPAALAASLGLGTK